MFPLPNSIFDPYGCRPLNCGYSAFSPSPLCLPTLGMLWTPPSLLPTERLRAAADQAFYSYDPYGKGFLETTNFYPALTELCRILGHPPPTYQEAMLAFQASDSNRDYRISYFEWIRFVSALFRILMF
jgi:hypothetical protein